MLKIRGVSEIVLPEYVGVLAITNGAILSHSVPCLPGQHTWNQRSIGGVGVAIGAILRCFTTLPRLPGEDAWGHRIRYLNTLRCNAIGAVLCCLTVFPRVAGEGAWGQ